MRRSLRSFHGVAAIAVTLLAMPANAADCWQSRLSAAPAGLGAKAAHDMGVTSATVLERVTNGAWTILHVEPSQLDNAYLFYASDPARADKFLTLWAGAAAPDERAEVLDWTLKNAPGIPLPLARCFARHVTSF